MASQASETDEPLTPTGRMFVQPEIDQVIHCAVGLARPIDVEAVRSAILGSFFLKHPRFRSLMLRDRYGIERWRETEAFELDRHLIIVESPLSSVNDYIADMTTGPGLSPEKPLWEIHFLMAHRCLVFRVHHTLVDGISMMSMLMSCCRLVGGSAVAPESSPAWSSRGKGKGVPLISRVMGFFRMVWFSLIFAVHSLMRLAWVRDHDTAISGGEGVEHWPRKIATAQFRMEDMEVVKRAVANATINDVLVGVVSSGLARYLDQRTPNALPEGFQITGLAMVNLRTQPGLPEISDLMKSNSQSRWGNKFGMILLPIRYHKSSFISDPLQHVKKVKVMLDRKKQSLEAFLTIKVSNYVMSYLGSKIAGFINYRFACNTSFTVSNIVGPAVEVALGDNPVTFMRVNISSLPHALIMHMLSYAGRAEMQLLVAKDIIPDPEFLAKCFEDALLEMKRAAIQ